MDLTYIAQVHVFILSLFTYILLSILIKIVFQLAFIESLLSASIRLSVRDWSMIKISSLRSVRGHNLVESYTSTTYHVTSQMGPRDIEVVVVVVVDYNNTQSFL